MDLAAAVAPTTLARQRTLPVAGPLIPLLPDGALPRGRAVSCRGIAATSLAVALAAEAAVAGSWLAVVDVPWLGVEAVAELGVPLERLVRVDPGADASWVDLVAAVLDGFELVITRMPQRLNAAVVRRVQARVQAREAVLITVGDPGPLLADITMAASSPVWEGVEHGWGRLRGRRVAVSATGRRVPRPRRADLWLPGPDGTVATATSPIVAVPTPVVSAPDPGRSVAAVAIGAAAG
jgi:hypothetical protein